MKAQAATAMSNDVFVGRQPIFNRQLDVFGYELLFRDCNTSRANVIDGNLATSQVIINTFLEIGIEHITSNRVAFINLTRDFLLGDIPLPLDQENLVLEVLEDVEIDEALLSALAGLKDKGYTIALDDFVFNKDNRGLLPYADIIKLDFMTMNEADIRSHVEIIRQHGIRLLAEKIETEAEFELCKELGFDYYQGYFFSRPSVISGKQLQANRLTLLQMIARLQDPDCDYGELESIISKDIAISYKLLRIINSSYYSLPSKVESIQRALVVLGLKMLRNWVTVIGLSQIDDKPSELINISLTRARMCEQLAERCNCKQDMAFTVGLFSMLDVLMDRPLDELLGELPLADEITAALESREGALGRLLELVITYDTGDWQGVSATCLLDINEVRQCYLDSIEWSAGITSQLQD